MIIYKQHDTMSNIFKSNSRFAILGEDNKEQKKKQIKDNNSKENNEFNRFKRTQNDRPARNYDNSYFKEQKERRLKEEQLQNELEKKAREEKKQENLSINNFPELAVKKVNQSETQCIKYSEIVKTKTVNKPQVETVDTEYEELKPGWCLIKKDKNTGKIITKYKETLTPKPREKTEQEIGLDIINALVKLYERQKEDYINMWGYDTWEKMYRFPNYDYEYFDKLDELYEEMENDNDANYYDQDEY